MIYYCKDFQQHFFYKNNRLFYIGLTFILFSIILLFANQTRSKTNKKLLNKDFTK